MPSSLPPVSPAIIRRIAPRLQIVGTHGLTPDSLAGGTTAFGGNVPNATNVDSRTRTRLCNVDVADLQVLYGNFYLEGNNGGVETSVANSTILRGAIEADSGLAVNPQLMRFGGALSTTMADLGMAMSDPVGIDCAPNTGLFIRGNLTLTAGQTFGARFNGVSAGENDVMSTGSSVYASTGPISGTRTFGVWPLAILGRPLTPTPACVIIGDSIGATGTGDDNVPGSPGDGAWFGFVCRAMRDTATGTSIPWAVLGRGSATMFAFNAGYSARQNYIAQFATFAIIQRACNDIGNAAFNLAQLQFSATQIWTSMKRRGLRTYQVLPGPRTQSGANTTPASGFEVGGKRDQFNAWVKTQVGNGLLDDYFDPNPSWEDPANPGRWLSNVFLDGIHPNSTGHFNAGNALRAKLKTWQLM